MAQNIPLSSKSNEYNQTFDEWYCESSNQAKAQSERIKAKHTFNTRTFTSSFHLSSSSSFFFVSLFSRSSRDSILYVRAKDIEQRPRHSDCDDVRVLVNVRLIDLKLSLTKTRMREQR